MRSDIYQVLSHKYTLIAILIGMSILTITTPNVPYFTGLVIAFITFWASKWKWREFGIGKTSWEQTIARAFAYSVILYIVVDFVLTPFVEYIFGTANYDAFQTLRGNLPSTLVFLLIMWVVAAVGEEFLFRGYFMSFVARRFGNTRKVWIISALFSSLLFGLAHQYQGVSGVIQTAMVGLVMAYLFFTNKKDLTLLIFVHGFYDTIGITLIYLDSERIISDYIIDLLKQ